MLPPGYPWIPGQRISAIRSSRLPGYIGNIYTNELAEVNGEIYIVLHQIKGLNDKILHNLPFSREHFQVFFND